MTTDVTYQQLLDVEKKRRETHRRHLVFSSLLLSLVFLSSLLVAAMIFCFFLRPDSSPSSNSNSSPSSNSDSSPFCSDSCRVVLLESIPEGVSFNSSSSHPSIFQAWMNLMDEARSSLDIASLYWTMTNEDTGTHHPTADQGEAVLKKLAELSGRLSVRVSVNAPQQSQPQHDLRLLNASGANVRTVNMRKLTSGVLHTKFWIVDKTHIYIGSANMDWRSLTQVKELGVAVYNCSCLASDLEKIFEVYWYLGATPTVPSHWPSNYSTAYNKDTPLQVALNATPSSVYLSSSPPSLCPDGRSSDLQSILSVMNDAHSFIYVAVMNFLPTTEFSHPKRYWAELDTTLRRLAFERHLKVRLLISCWSNTPPLMLAFLRSLASLTPPDEPRPRLDVQVRLFVVPSSPEQKTIPFARVNHNKYMVTDKVAYIGTSNWSGDYFISTAGSALIINQTASAPPPDISVQSQLKEVFERDWSSAYSTPLTQNSHPNDLC